jgi:hypothetical protein
MLRGVRDGEAYMKSVGIREAKARLSELARDAAKGGNGSSKRLEGAMASASWKPMPGGLQRATCTTDFLQPALGTIGSRR